MADRKNALEYPVIHLAIRLIVALALLVLHDAALLVEFLLGYDAQEMAHAVGLHPQRQIKSVLRHILKIVRAVEVCCAVYSCSADEFEWLEIFVIVIFTAVEHQVLKQVSESGLAGFLVLRSDVIPDIYSHYRCFVIFMNNQTQAVVEREFGVVNVEIAGHGHVERKEYQCACHADRTFHSGISHLKAYRSFPGRGSLTGVCAD